MTLTLQEKVTVQTLIFTKINVPMVCIYLMSALNHYPLNFAFLSFPYSVLFHNDVTTFANIFFFVLQKFLKSFQAKRQGKSIQWFNFSYTKKNKQKVRNKYNTQFFLIMMSFFFVWCHKIISFFSNKLFLQFLMKNYCLNTFSSFGLDLNLKTCD